MRAARSRSSTQKSNGGQLPLRFGSWGGRRPGAGRPRKKSSGIPHAKRPKLASRHPVHVTLKLRPEVGKLRSKPGYRAIRAAFVAGCKSDGFRVCHYSVQNRHVHILVEAKDRKHLSRGMQGLAIRMARGVNRAFEREGRVFAERYHAHILKTPREVKNSLSYVLNNSLRHCPVKEGDWYILREDPFSSGAWFDGWGERAHIRCLPTGPPPVRSAKTWLLAVGWRRYGLLVPTYIPPRRARR
jgi:REP element-mobilizing transposase RayT